MDENSDKLGKAGDSFSEQKKKLDIALYYTHSDEEKAREMISGTYKDVFAIKVKFSASTTFGAFLLFFNIPYTSLVNSYVIMSHSYIVDDLKTRSPWRTFEEGMEKINKENQHDGELTSKMRDEIANAFTLKIGYDQRANELKKYLELKDEITANRLIKKFVTDKFGFQNINLSVDYEQISSVDMELNSTTSKKINFEALQQKGEKKEEPAGTGYMDEDEHDIDKKDIQLILKGNLILSPIKGKTISSVEIGDRIKISLDSSSPKAVTVAKAFKAYDDGKISPLTGRVVSIRNLVNGGYKLYCLIAKGIYIRIDEEEEDIRIAVDSPDEIENMKDIKYPYIMVIGIVIFVFIAIILVVVLVPG